MTKSKIWSEKVAHNKERGMAFLLPSSIISFFTLVIALLSGGVIGTFTSTVAIVIGILLLALILALRQYELAIVMIVVAHIYIDWYQGLEIVGSTIAVGLLLLLFVVRSPQYPWVTPHALWLWCLYLVLTIFPVIQGAQSRYDLAYYYPNVIFGALVMFWLGILVARDRIHLRTLFQILAALGTLLAVHTIIQATTGIVVFGTARFDAYLAQVSNFGLGNSGVSRAGSLFENPDWNGTFLAVMLFLPFSLFAETTSLLQKFLYFTEMLAILIALLFTYSIGAWIGALAGMIVFMLFAGRNYYRMLIPALIITIGVILLTVFPREINLLFQRTSDPTGLSLRSGAWQTAINVIRAFPLMGIGLGMENYLQRAEAYRVPSQYTPLAHPHNSYLELGAMAGLPVLIVFLALLLLALGHTWHNWIRGDTSTRCLLGGGIASIMALSVNSLSINGWTLPPLATVGWLILGAIASPLIIRNI